ncbi:MAG: helix-turn-helix transcriptional regulator [Nitriliruptoraceae bacterium]|nr:helix-turn-helix transcriptional regulator [Nitriliruptoraceae bacterium]
MRDPQWLRGVLPLLVLAVLREGECYGYDLTRKLEAAGLGTVKGGSLYPVLARLEADGAVAIRWSEPTSGPARKYYRLTPAGHEQLQAGASRWLAFTEHAAALLTPSTSELNDATP